MTEVTVRPEDVQKASEPSADGQLRSDGSTDAKDPSRTVMRPVWVGPPKPSTYAHQPAINDHPTFLRCRLPAPRARTAQVVVTRRYAEPVPVVGNGSPGRWELFLRGGTIYEVDCGLHHTSFPIELPSALDTFPFQADVAVEWQVVRPAWVVHQGLKDVREALRPLVRRRLCEVTQSYEADAVTAAEDRIAATDLRHLGERYGLKVVLTVHLSADERAAEQAAMRRKAEQHTVVDELERRTMHNRIEHYRSIIDGGDVEQIALSLAQEPGGAEKIVAMIRDMREKDRRQVTEFLTQLIDSGAIDRWDVEDHVRAALDWLKASTTHTVQTGDAHIPRDRRHGRPVSHGPGGSNIPNPNGAAQNGSTEGVDPESIVVMNGDGATSLS